MKFSSNLLIIIILLSIASCLSNKNGENIKVYSVDLKFDSVNYTDTSIVRKRIEIIDESEYEFYFIPGQDTTLKFIIGDTRDDLKSIRFGNDTCEFIASRKYNINGKEIEVLKFNLDDVNAADEEAYIYYIKGIGLLAYYSYIWDLVFFLEYDETIGLKELMFSEDTKFFISKYKHQYISLTELDIYLLNKGKDLCDFKNFHIWQRGNQNECFVFDYFTNGEFF
jgi:hypothetical protein